MEILVQIKLILRDSLQLGNRADGLTADTPLLGGMPEFDSMAVVAVVTMLEERFDIEIDDDELSAELFATVGSLERFVAEKLSG